MRVEPGRAPSLAFIHLQGEQELVTLRDLSRVGQELGVGLVRLRKPGRSSLLEIARELVGVAGNRALEQLNSANGSSIAR